MLGAVAHGSRGFTGLVTTKLLSDRPLFSSDRPCFCGSVHDRVQEAAYSLIPQHRRPGMHLGIGRALWPDMHPDELIDVVDHLNRGSSLLTDQEERERVAELNLRAGLKAKAAAAHSSAVTYLSAGMALLDGDSWKSRHELTFALWRERAECEFLCGGFDRAEVLISELLIRSASKIDKAAAYRLKTDFHVMKSENAMAVESYLARGLEDIGMLYLQKARQCYLRWGGHGKARQLERAYPGLSQPEATAAAQNTIGAPVERLELATVIKVSQAFSGEIVLEKMLETLMRTALEHAGAERGVLIVTRAGEPRIVAEAGTTGDAIDVRIHARPVSEGIGPQSVLQYVMCTQESVILDDAAVAGPFTGDPHIVRHRARSILCLPLVNQAKLVGVLYLENNLAPRVFVPARISVLKLLASQAAISIENARLYRNLAEREARIRRLVDANIVGVFFWDLDGRILEANDAFLRIVGFNRQDFTAGTLRWTELTPPEWLDWSNES